MTNTSKTTGTPGLSDELAKLEPDAMQRLRAACAEESDDIPLDAADELGSPDDEARAADFAEALEWYGAMGEAEERPVHDWMKQTALEARTLLEERDRLRAEK